MHTTKLNSRQIIGILQNVPTIFRIPRDNPLFLSFDQQKEAFLPTMETRVCSDKRPIALENPSGESERSFRWLRPLSWQTARKLDLFFSLLQFLPLDFQTRIVSYDEHRYEHCLERSLLLIPRIQSLRCTYALLYTFELGLRRRSFVCRKSKRKRFYEFRIKLLIYSIEFASSLCSREE